MKEFINKWLTISFFNLLLVALLGVVLRYKIAFYLPFFEQKFVLHSHSHFAFSGWITQVIMVLLIYHVSLQNNEQVIKKKYRWLLIANLVSAYGMLVSFILQGYAFFSITFSTLSIIVSYFFAVYYWKDLNKLNRGRISSAWFKSALIFSVISSLGTFFLAYMMVSNVSDQYWHLASVYFFLHFQYNGWFFFAGMGLLVSKIEGIPNIYVNLRSAFVFFFSAAIPAYFLSVLWIPLSPFVYGIIVTAVICQIAGWILTIKTLLNNRIFIRQNFSKYGRLLLVLSAVAFSMKLLLQSGSVHPALSQLSYSFRPIIIGYLHLVLLAVTSIFIIGYIVAFELAPITQKLLVGIAIFVIGVIINELLLMVQGVAALAYKSIPLINILLFLAAVILLSGVSFIFISQLTRLKEKDKKVF